MLNQVNLMRETRPGSDDRDNYDLDGWQHKYRKGFE